MGQKLLTKSLVSAGRAAPATITFTGSNFLSCDGEVQFQVRNFELNLAGSDTVAPSFTPEIDSQFQCGMGMLNAYVKVVDNVNNIGRAAVAALAEKYISASGGMACCKL